MIILPACGVFMNSVDQGWGQTLASWGYVALTLDIFTSRGIEGVKTCLHPAQSSFNRRCSSRMEIGLAREKYVDRNRIFLMPVSGRVSSVVLSAVERAAEVKAEHSFRGAAAFYPACNSEKGVMTVSTLVVVGALNAMEANACRKDGAGRKRDRSFSTKGAMVISVRFTALTTNAYSGFDLPGI